MALEDKTLLDLANETDETKFKEGFSKLTEDQQKQVTAHLTDEAVKAKNAVTALNEEARRKKEQADKAAADAANANNNQTKSFEEKFRLENIAEAKAKVYAQMGIAKDEDKQIISDFFNKLDSGAVTVENIMKDVRKAVAAAKDDEFIGASQKLKDFEAGAEEYNRTHAGNTGGNTVDRTDGKTYSKEAEDMVREAARRGHKLSLDEAENYLSKGPTRIIR